MLYALAEGWRWCEDEFVFTEGWRQEDMNSGVCDAARTTRELVKAMNSLVSFLQFEGEDASMFSSKKLPTLDTQLWVDQTDRQIRFEFYEKPTVPNRVLQKDTALSEQSIRTSLTQEVVRRLKNTCAETSCEDRSAMLSKFSQKLVNSGHSVASAQYILVHGAIRYTQLVRNSLLDANHPEYKPLYCDKSYNTANRRLHKLLSKTGWYEEDSVVKKTK